MGLFHCDEGQADEVLTETHSGHGSLDGNGIDLGEQGTDQRKLTGLIGHGTGNVAAEELPAQFGSGLRSGV